MDATGDQCLRLKKTLSPCSFSAVWNGGHRKDDLFVPIGTTGCGFLGPREVSCKPLDALCFCCYRPSQSKLPILLGVVVAKSEQWQCIPTRLSIEQFQQFVLPHLSIGSRGPAPKLTLHAVFNYILQSLYLGCQWKELPIEKDQEGRPEIHYTRIYGAFRRWQADGCFEAVFAGSVLKLHQANLLDTTVIWHRVPETNHCRREGGRKDATPIRSTK